MTHFRIFHFYFNKTRKKCSHFIRQPQLLRHPLRYLHFLVRLHHKHQIYHCFNLVLVAHRVLRLPHHLPFFQQQINLLTTQIQVWKHRGSHCLIIRFLFYFRCYWLVPIRKRSICICSTSTNLSFHKSNRYNN